MPRLTHLCERCHRRTELFYCKPVDEYLCEECEAMVYYELEHAEESFDVNN